MCEFVSWIEKDGCVLFLTGDNVFHTQRGKELQAHCASPDDLHGHGAIMFYYNLDHDKYVGCHRECTDFSSSYNFPAPIVDAIKAGKMWGFGRPKGLLNSSAWAEYEKIYDSARAERKKICDNTFWDLFACVENRVDTWK